MAGFFMIHLLKREGARPVEDRAPVVVSVVAPTRCLRETGSIRNKRDVGVVGRRHPGRRP